jgi:hypothetical protein
MPISKYRIDGSQHKIKCEMLDLPYTMLGDASGYQMLSVVEDMHDECKMHVNFSDVMDTPESWGAYLSEVACVIARDYADYFDMTEAEVLAAIRNGFNGNRADAPAPTGDSEAA